MKGLSNTPKLTDGGKIVGLRGFKGYENENMKGKLTKVWPSLVGKVVDLPLWEFL